LAGAHYSKETIAWMDKNMPFVDKASNPPNVLKQDKERTFGVVWLQTNQSL
jgi:hypothetical protein